MPGLTFVDDFADLPDPRVLRSRVHDLIEMLVIAFLAVVCGAESWNDVARFGRAKIDWLRERLDLELRAGIPSDDTFRRVFSCLDPEAFELCFRARTATLKKQINGDIITLDGKALRHSFDTAAGQGALNLVRAWSSGQRLMLGMMRVAEGSNEIPTAQALLELLDLSGATVTADAAHRQKVTAEKIVSSGGDYVLAVKGSQLNLKEDIASCFGHTERHPAAPSEWRTAADGREIGESRRGDYGHGRLERRSVSMLRLAENDPGWHDVQQKWPGLRTLLKVERTRTTNDKTSNETVYYISNRIGATAEFGSVIRRRWRIENSLHWALDIGFDEDASRIRRDHAPENFAILRGMAINALQRNKSQAAGVKAKRKLAGWDNDDLTQLLG